LKPEYIEPSRLTLSSFSLAPPKPVYT